MQERLAERTAGVPADAAAHVGGMASIPSGNTGPAPRIEDGSADQAEVIREAVTEARRMGAIGLGVLRAGASSERHRQLLDSNFHTTDPTDLATAREVLTRTLTGMNSDLPIEVESTSKTLKGDANGYVYGGPFAALSDIHLTPKFFAESASDQGATVLHESTHKFARTVDHAYAGTDDFIDLSPAEALENADSYANFCRGHMEDRRREDEAENEQRVEEASRSQGEEVWIAWEEGGLILGKDSFTTSSGVVLPIGVVERVVLERFGDRHRAHYQEVLKALEAGHDRHGVVLCSDGYSVSGDLVQAIADEEAL